MSRSKLIRFCEIERMENVFEPNKPIYHSTKGSWSKLVFGNYKTITLELGCGKGEYTVGLAKIFPNRNFIGVDLKGERIWKGAREAQELKLKNVRFLRTQVELLENFFAENEVGEIWLTFPDPRPKRSEEKRRLASLKFLKIYQKILQPGGKVHLKTDSEQLFDYTQNLVKKMKKEDKSEVEIEALTRDLYSSSYLVEHHGLETSFEKKFLEKNQPIFYLRFKF